MNFIKMICKGLFQSILVDNNLNQFNKDNMLYNKIF